MLDFIPLIFCARCTAIFKTKLSYAFCVSFTVFLLLWLSWVDVVLSGWPSLVYL